MSKEVVTKSVTNGHGLTLAVDTPGPDVSAILNKTVTIGLVDAVQLVSCLHSMQ